MLHNIKTACVFRSQHEHAVFHVALWFLGNFKENNFRGSYSIWYKGVGIEWLLTIIYAWIMNQKFNSKFCALYMITYLIGNNDSGKTVHHRWNNTEPCQKCTL